MKLTNIFAAALCLLSTQAMAFEASEPGAVKMIRTCVDNGDYLYFVELDNGFKVFNYQDHATNSVESTHRKNNFEMLLTAYQTGQKVEITRHNNGQTKCGIGSSGELAEVILNSGRTVD